MVAAPARANFVPTFDSATSSGNTFNYTVQFATSLQIPPSGPPPLAGLQLPAGSFLTIYDIPNLVSATVAPAFTGMFTVSIQNTGITATGTKPMDGPLPNVTLTYIDTKNTLIESKEFKDALTITTSGNSTNFTTVGNYTDQLEKGPFALSQQGTLVGDISSVPIPGVPEPASVVMMGIGGLGVGAVRCSAIAKLRSDLRGVPTPLCFNGPG